MLFPYTTLFRSGRAETQPGRHRRLAVEDPVPHPHAGEPHEDVEAEEASLTRLLPGPGDVGGPEDAVLLERLKVHGEIFDKWGVCPPGAQTRHSGPERSP